MPWHWLSGRRLGCGVLPSLLTYNLLYERSNTVPYKTCGRELYGRTPYNNKFGGLRAALLDASYTLAP